MNNKWLWISVAAAVGWYLVEQRRKADRIAAYERMTADYYKSNPGLRVSEYTAAPCECGQRHYGARIGARLWQPTEGVRL